MPDLPRGTITFLLTDIEGSTRLWEQHPAAMRQALARHDSLIEQSVVACEGVVIKPRGEGDSRFAVFARATDAVRCACDIQRALWTEAWESPVQLRTRIALHTGEAELRDADYYGSAVNRCARLRSLGHGGQTLLSQVTHDLVQDSLPVGVRLRDMGIHRLRDLQRPERVYQLVIPNVPQDFPPLRSLHSLPNNLPQPLTSFVGRTQAITEIKTLLQTSALLTITGAGGCGKSRLSLQVASELLDRYPDGVWLVELAALTDPALVPQTIAQVLQLDEENQPLMTALQQALQYKAVLLILDNCEHLVDACAHLANNLLQHCPHLHILATSREALGVPGEITWRLPSLSIPNVDRLPSLEALTQYESVQLFLDRALTAHPQFQVTAQNAEAIAQICQRLDGIALAIELAAARTSVLTAEQIATRLDQMFRLLTGGSRTLLPRQQTLKALVDWSYNLLPVVEQQVFQRLSVFVNGWSLAAAETICSGDGLEEWDILDGLSHLVDKSLVIVETQPNGECRYRLLEILRQYSRELTSQFSVELGRRHRDFFLQLAEAATPHLDADQQQIWLDRLELEHDNLRSALQYCTSQANQETGLRLATALCPFWIRRGYWSEGYRLLEAALETSQNVPAQLRASALSGLGSLAWSRGDYAQAQTLYEQSLELSQALDNQAGVAEALNHLSSVAWRQSQYDRAQALAEESLSIFRELGHQQGIARLLNRLGNVLYERDPIHNTANLATVQQLYEESLALFQELGNRFYIGEVLISLGRVALAQGECDRATALCQEGLDLKQSLGDKRGVTYSLHILGQIARHQKDWALARSHYEQIIPIQRELGNSRLLAYSLSCLGQVAQEQADAAVAVACFQEALTLYHCYQDQRGMATTLERLAQLAQGHGQYDRSLRLLGAAAAVHPNATPTNTISDSPAWHDGYTMPLPEAIAYALDDAFPLVR